MYPAQTDNSATMVRMILLALSLILDPVGSVPVGSVSVIDSTRDTAQRETAKCMQLINRVAKYTCLKKAPWPTDRLCRLNYKLSRIKA